MNSLENNCHSHQIFNRFIYLVLFLISIIISAIVISEIRHFPIQHQEMFEHPVDV
jgi:hypothetical protein